MVPQLDLFGNESSQTPSKKKGGVRRRVHNDGDDVEHIDEHPDIYVNSDGNILRYVDTIGKTHMYEYVQSNTKLGQRVMFTNTGLANFIESNALIPRREFVAVKDLRKNATRLQKKSS